MVDLVIFGGTTEGRQLADFCARTRTSAVLCVASEVGTEQITGSPSLTVRAGRLDRDSIVRLLRAETPKIVADATHPFATEITSNVVAACAEVGVAYVRVVRPKNQSTDETTRYFPSINKAVDWLNTTSGVIFAATGVKEAEALTRVNNFRERVILRVLPIPSSIEACVGLGYPSHHLIAMQGPFSHDLNAAMFRHTGSEILVTKDSGTVGGLDEKLSAAVECEMLTAMITRPNDIDGVSVTRAEEIIIEVVTR